jgi:hypothetical protein
MSNPWLKKNPFMSMWLSGANRMAGMMRGQAKRQINTAITQATNDNIKSWASAFDPTAPKTRPKRRR